MGAIRWMLVVVGTAAILAAFVWTWITRHGRIDELLSQLRDVDPRVRARAGVSMIEDGSRRAAKELQTYLMREPDARARLAIALAVTRRSAQGTRGDFEQWAAAELAGIWAVAASSPVEAVRPPQAVAYATADSAPPADRAIHWKVEPDT